VPIFGDDGALRDEGVIRVTDMGFAEEVLLDQDKFLTAVLLRPEFQKKMTGTELRYRLGAFYAEQERRNGVAPGLLSTCHKLGIPVFVGAPSDGSVFLNSMKLWAMKQAGLIPDYEFDLDLHAEVFEACAYHYWGLFESDAKAIATLILGGGVPKNFNLQPEPALGQVLGLPNVRGYEFDVQITTAPVTDGSLSSCPPAEAVTWGKVDKETYQQSTESLPGDYSMMMPFIVKALLEKHGVRDATRLYEKRERLVETLRGAVQDNREWLMESLKYARQSAGDLCGAVFRGGAGAGHDGIWGAAYDADSDRRGVDCERRDSNYCFAVRGQGNGGGAGRLMICASSNSKSRASSNCF
jgi:deoxyhypusine synthase